jgi:hypothetical protein
VFAKKPVKGGDEVVGTFDVGQVPTVWNELERAFSEVGDCFSCLRDREYAIGFALDDERRYLQIGEPIQQHFALPS